MGERSQMYSPLDAQVVPRFAGPVTFLRLPQVPSAEGLDVAIAGVPFDCGASFRPGARFGPRAVREISSLLRPYNRVLGVNPFEVLRTADVGDLSINPLDTQSCLQAISDQIEMLVRQGIVPVCVGGDHTIGYGTMRGVARALGQPVAMVQIDAHLDTWDSYFGNRYTHGTFLRRLLEEGYVDGTHSIQIGIRGPLFGPEDLEVVDAFGLEVVPAEDVASSSVKGVAERIAAKVAGRPVYLTFDIDAVDPAFAPGTGTPEVGGLTSLQAIQLIQELAGLSLVGAEIVEVSPPFDQSQVTALLAARLILEILSVLAVNRQSRR